MDTEPATDLLSVMEQYREEIHRCRYGSFRGVIKDGRVVVFAVEHEWRPDVEARRQRVNGTHEDEGDAKD